MCTAKEIECRMLHLSSQGGRRDVGSANSRHNPNTSRHDFLCRLLRRRRITNRAERRSPPRLARCSWLAKLQGIRITLVLCDTRRRLSFDTFRPRAFDFPPEGRPGHSSGQVEHLGNFLPIKSFAMRAKHSSTLMRKFATRLLQTPVGELRTTKFHRIASNLRNDQTVQTKVGYPDESNTRHTGI